MLALNSRSFCLSFLSARKVFDIMPSTSYTVEYKKACDIRLYLMMSFLRDIFPTCGIEIFWKDVHHS
jgi:hypothetical protein